MSPGVFKIIDPFLPEAGTSDLFEILSDGTVAERTGLLGGIAFILTGTAVAVAGFNQYILPWQAGPAGVVAGMAGLVALGFAGASFDYRKRRAGQAKVNALEEQARNDPGEPKLAWDLARRKLESYLDRNLRQVSSIFYLTSLVMLFGLGLIGYGVFRGVQSPDKLDPAALGAVAGIVVEIIGGTLLLIYRSTMSQANGYVVVLERINAVGMSINIIEGIEGESSQLRDDARVQLAHNLLRMYDPRSSNPVN